MAPLTRAFFLQPTIEVARQLLGLTLITKSPAGETSGVIVETEAYLGSSDPAAHSYRGETPRTKTMFGEPGRAYVYFTYGMHTCLNVVTAPSGTGDAVLIRALEPTTGIDIMQRRRQRDDIHRLCSGPAKLVQALGVTLTDNGQDFLSGSRLRLVGDSVEQDRVAVSPRIGIKKAADLPLRFFIKGSKFVSR